jgi:hypothetical protein
MSRTPHCLHSLLTDGGDIVSLTGQSRSIPPSKSFLVLISVPEGVNLKAMVCLKDDVI